MKPVALTFLLVLTLVAAAVAQEKMSKAEKAAAKAEKRAARAERESAPPAPAAPVAVGFEAYRFVRTRNIFDPTRRGLRIETPSAAQAAATSGRRSRVLALTGTMVTANRSLAFFAGVENRVIGVGEMVANFKVTKIDAAKVSLERDGKPLQLDVGRQIALESSGGEGADGPPIIEAAAPVEAPPMAPGAPAPAPAGGGDKNEILRRMMERRAQEVGK